MSAAISFSLDPCRIRIAFDLGDACAGQAEANLGLRYLEIFAEEVAEIGHQDGIMAVAPNLRTRVASQSIFAQLVSLACHDLGRRSRRHRVRAHAAAPRLARGAGRPLRRHDRRRVGADDQAPRPPGSRGRIGAGRFDVLSRSADSRALVDAGRCTPRRARSPRAAERRSRSIRSGRRIACRARRMHPSPRRARAGHARGRRLLGLDQPVGDGVGAIALGDDLKDFGAAVCSRVLDAMGAEQLDGERLVVRLPQA